MSSKLKVHPSFFWPGEDKNKTTFEPEWYKIITTCKDHSGLPWHVIECMPEQEVNQPGLHIIPNDSRAILERE